MIRRPPRSTPFPTRRSSDLSATFDGVGEWVDTRNQFLQDRGAFTLEYWVAPSDRKSTRLNSSHSQISYAVFCLKKKNNVFGTSGALLSHYTVHAYSSYARRE